MKSSSGHGFGAWLFVEGCRIAVSLGSFDALQVQSRI